MHEKKASTLLKKRGTCEKTKREWHAIRADLFEAPYPHLTCFKFKKGGARGFDLKYESLCSTDPTLDIKKDTSLTTLLTDGKSLYKALNDLLFDLYHADNDRVSLYVTNRSNLWNVFLTELRDLFVKLEGEKATGWALTSPSTPQTILFDEEVRVKVGRGLVESGDPSLLSREKKQISVCKEILQKIWTSTTALLEEKRLGSVAFAGFLLERKNRARPLLAKLQKRRKDAPLTLNLFRLEKEIKEIKAVNQLERKIFSSFG